MKRVTDEDTERQRNRILQKEKDCHRKKQSITELNRVLQRETECYREKQSVIQSRDVDRY